MLDGTTATVHVEAIGKQVGMAEREIMSM